jgi:hypothetical protein
MTIKATISERLEQRRRELGMPSDWLDYTLRTAETIQRQQTMIDISTRTMTRMSVVHSLDLCKIKKLDAALKRAAELIVKLDLDPGASDEILTIIREAREP